MNDIVTGMNAAARRSAPADGPVEKKGERETEDVFQEGTTATKMRLLRSAGEEVAIVQDGGSCKVRPRVKSKIRPSPAGSAKSRCERPDIEQCEQNCGGQDE